MAFFKETSNMWLQIHSWSLLPQLARHTSWVKERLLRWWSLESGCPPPARQRAASFARTAARRRPWSNLPAGAAAEQADGSLARWDACVCPASEEHGRCGLGCGAGRQIQHLNRERKREDETGLLSCDQTHLNTSVQNKQKATMYPEIIKQLSAQPLKPHTEKEWITPELSLPWLPYFFSKD